MDRDRQRGISKSMDFLPYLDGHQNSDPLDVLVSLAKYSREARVTI